MKHPSLCWKQKPQDDPPIAQSHDPRLRVWLRSDAQGLESQQPTVEQWPKRITPDFDHDCLGVDLARELDVLRPSCPERGRGLVLRPSRTLSKMSQIIGHSSDRFMGKGSAL